ncbi:hypothetical protein BGX34_010164 [Mortierella sp. NVP85]|nr:hypothetical protein BGX34_010164 [Mortierella sp. NVP85]
MSPIRLFLEQDPPSQAIHSGVVGFIVLIFIVARVLTTRGFAALKPGFNTRAIVTWFACTSLTLMTTYSAMLAYLLYKESMAGVYVGPKAPSNFEPATLTTFTFPLTVSFSDMSNHPEWDISQVALSDGQSPYYILSMKPTALYSIGSIHFLFALRLVLKLSQCGLMACLLLLNTYWCHHVEALVDEGNFMSKTEMYTYYVLAGLSLFAPVGAYLGVGFGFNDWRLAWRASDVCLLIIGVGIIVGYALTCIRLRALERDSRNVNGGDTSTTLQLTYYVYCVYWLIGSMIVIMLLGILYKFTLVNPDLYPVRARAINDLQGALWSTVIIMVYPAAMFLLYPSVDVLTQPSNDPGSRFPSRVRRTVRDAKRIRESLYLEGDSLNGADGGNHSSQHGLTISPGHSNRSSESGQPHTPQPQRFSFSYEPYRRERMGSITAMVNELQLIREEEGAGTESVELARIPGSLSDQKEGIPIIHSTRAPSMDGKTVTEVSPKSDITEIRKKSGSFTRNRNETKDVEEQSRAGTTWSEQTIAQDNHSHDDNKNDFIVAIPAAAAAATVSVMSKYDSKVAPLSDPDQQKPATLSTTVSPSKSATPIKPATSSKPPVAPLTGILKTRNSTQSPPDQAGGAILPAPQSATTPTIGKRMSSMQGAQHAIGSRKSAEYAPVKRKNSTSSSTSKSPPAVSVSAPNTPVDPPLPSPASQQRRSNVTARVDAGALALAAQQQHHLFQQSHQRAAKSRSSRDGIEVDYFGLRKPSSDGSATTPPPLPYEPQMQVIQSMNISPEMTGFLMADPYPSAGTRYNEGDGDQDMVSDTQSEGGHGDSYKRAGGNVNCSKKYKAPPPPIPIDAANARSTERVVGVSTAPATPTTPTTPLGVRPRRSVDTVVDPQILEMAGKMYEDHVIPEHVMQAMSRTTPSTPSTLPATSPEAPVVHAIKIATPGPPVRVVSESSAPPQSPIQPNQQSPPQQYQRVVSPPAKSPYRARESFESRITQGGPSATGSPHIPGQGIATPPSPTSTASPTITSTTTLPRPLTPAWYETKTNSASTNDVLHRYNAVTRGNYQQQQQQPQPQQQQAQPSGNKLLFYDESPIGPLDDAAPTPHDHQQQQQQQEGERYRESYLPQPRMGSADSFGVVRTRSSGGKDDEQRYQQHQVVQRTPQHQQQIDRHSFMMPSDHLSAHTWTGNLSDVTTNTSGEVSVGAFVDRKHPHQQHYRRKSGDESEAKDRDVRKSQASAYSMGSCFGVGSSAGSRQSAGAYSNYSSNSGFGSGSIFVSGSLSAVGQAGSGSSEALLTVASGALHKQHSGPLKKRSSDHRGGHGSLNESSGSSTGGSSHGHGHEGGSKETHLSDAPSRMNSVRLSAFGPGEDEEDGTLTGDTNMDMQMSLELERKIQQEWLDRRAAVKKDSKTRLEQLHKQHQEQAEQEQQNQQRLQQRDRQQRYLQFQMDQEREVQEGAHPSSRAESTHMSVNAASPGDSAISSPSTIATSGTTEPPSPSPNSQFMYSSASAPASRPYESTTSSSYEPRQVGRTQGLESEYAVRAEENDDEGSNALMQSSTSYALHRQSRNKLATPQNALTLQQPLQTPNPSLLHYDSVDSIATIRATHRYPSVSPSPSSPSPQRPASSRSGPSSPSSPSPSPMLQRPLYGQHHQPQQGFYPPQPHYQQPRSQQPPSPGASISQVGPSQYRIVPDNLAQRERVGATGATDGEDPASRSMSPVQRTSSRLTNLTSTGSDYQWESAELNQHQWEMLGTSTSRSN